MRQGLPFVDLVDCQISGSEVELLVEEVPLIQRPLKSSQLDAFGCLSYHRKRLIDLEFVRNDRVCRRSNISANSLNALRNTVHLKEALVVLKCGKSPTCHKRKKDDKTFFENLWKCEGYERLKFKAVTPQKRSNNSRYMFR